MPVPGQGTEGHYPSQIFYRHRLHRIGQLEIEYPGIEVEFGLEDAFDVLGAAKTVSRLVDPGAHIEGGRRALAELAISAQRPASPGRDSIQQIPPSTSRTLPRPTASETMVWLLMGDFQEP